ERDGAVAGVAIINAVQFPVDELLVGQLRARPDVSRSTVEEVRRVFGVIKAGAFPKGALLLGAGASYWAQWIEYSRQSPTTLSRLSPPLLLVQCMNDETLPGEMLARNVAILRGVASTKRDARLHELDGHDHFGIRPGEHESSPVFMRVLLDWLRETAARNATRAKPVGYTARPCNPAARSPVARPRPRGSRRASRVSPDSRSACSTTPSPTPARSCIAWPSYSLRAPARPACADGASRARHVRPRSSTTSRRKRRSS